MAALAGLSQFHFGVFGWERYLRYREFWGGTPQEVYSHWLDMVLMSGNSLAFAWFISSEAFFRRGRGYDSRLGPRIRSYAIFGMILSGAIATVLDGFYGEGTVLLSYLIFFVPILGAAYYLLRRIAVVLAWNPAIVVAVALANAAAQIAAQIRYEPSENGAPSTGNIPIWLAYVGLASAWALGRAFKTGRLRSFFTHIWKLLRKPLAWGSITVILLGLGVPATLRASRLHKEREEFVMKWLDELESSLTDSFVNELKRDHSVVEAKRYEKIPISAAAQPLLEDTRIKAGNSLRVYMPLHQSEYLFLWGNDHFSYCDVRSLTSEGSVQIDQWFIDELRATGGTHRTGFYSILWSPHIAGRLLKDSHGAVKAICVINSPDGPSLVP